MINGAREDETGGDVGEETSEEGIEDMIRNMEIPGFPPLALYLGIATIALMLRPKPRKY